MKKILVLGGTRFFGKQLINRLLESGNKVTIATRGLTSDPFGDEVERLIIDRTQQSTLLKAFKNKSWDIVYDQTCYTPKEAFDAASSLEGKVKRYILTSSQAVYPFGINQKEEAFNPHHFSFKYRTKKSYQGYAGYQEGKRGSESVLLNHGKFEVVAVRFPIVVGQGDHTKRLEFHMNKVLKNEPIGVSNINARYSFIHFAEAADFLCKMGASPFTGAINPGCREDLSIGELLKKIQQQTRLPVNITSRVTGENASRYELDGSCSINTDRATSLGFTFSTIHQTFDPLIEFYFKQMKN
ncbi:NAD-dependent epimerase/dehydratase family protein [Halobacillus sp. Marseille-Q1614]|uniref:NAD-dependent epimerase/dehydratase family protein n=1 Tax=Halobacillus sp. Marseille-Q1614 TaxID=2709134 RepID=UPI00156DF86A|nr:NAD-dependent epimerase/dehydratase family protein [Halobacillus sp. Marseille-Q1614]